MFTSPFGRYKRTATTAYISVHHAYLSAYNSRTCSLMMEVQYGNVGISSDSKVSFVFQI